MSTLTLPSVLPVLSPTSVIDGGRSPEQLMNNTNEEDSATISFKQKNALQKHIKLHIGEKSSWSCKQCGKSFSIINSYYSNKMLFLEISLILI